MGYVMVYHFVVSNCPHFVEGGVGATRRGGGDIQLLFVVGKVYKGGMGT